MSPHELTLVMPVYNEEACVCAVVTAWHDELARLGIDFRMLILNDGSRDTTADRLLQFADNLRITVINKPNSGHGPTILQGYRLAVEQSSWVFQTDSDDEMGPEHFVELWQRRHDYAALFGVRIGRQQGFGRWLISTVSRFAIQILFQGGVTDVNTPYRLLRSSVLAQIIAQVPADTFAPNVLISGGVAVSRLPLFNFPVPHHGRKTGQVSIVRWGLWKAAVRSLLQTIRFSSHFVRVAP